MGGSSGGSSSGAISYPGYMQNRHETWLTDINVLITNALSVNPYLSISAYNPTTEVTAMVDTLSQFNTYVNNYIPITEWESLIDAIETKLSAVVFDTTEIANAVEAYSAQVLARLTNSVLPIYQRGMQNVRAVMTSAYTVGEALLTADSTRDINKFEADLTKQFYDRKTEAIITTTNTLLNQLMQKLDFYRHITHYAAETGRIKLTALKEQIADETVFREKQYTWGLELFQYGGNMLGAVSGGVTQPNRGISTTKSVLGGAMSGAASGAMVGSAVPGIGTGIGAAAGGLLGGLAGLLN